MTTEQEIRLRQLLKEYSADQANSEAVSEMLDLLNEAGSEPVLQEFVLSMRHNTHTEAADWEAVWDKVNPIKVRTINWKWVGIAASIVLILGLGWYFFTPSFTQKPAVAILNDVKPPEANHATITLGDGKQINLNNVAAGSIAEQGAVKVTRTADGQIVYQGRSTEVIYNILSNPKGSQVIDMTLADGSRVWLNAGSSIRYPVSFTTNERKISITGEAYFEVAHNPQQPFKVSKGDMEVTVLGTHFNINAFEDERDIKVTLLEGSVKVTRTAANELRILSPGEQAIVTSSGPINLNGSPDLEEVMAWKNGRFIFKGNDIETIMRQLARWYNVEIIYNGKINDVFYAEIPRNTMASDVLKALELTGKVHFTIEGKKIIVNP